MIENPKTVGTHNGRFHSDEIFAIATLKELYPKLKIIRSRDLEELRKLDLRVDVGERYNPETGDFDHHQKSFTDKGPSGIPYSSFGLIWKHYGMKLCKSQKIWASIEERLVRFIDAGDNGINSAKEGMFIYAIGHVITALFSPMWNEEGIEDKRFEEAVEFARSILRREIERGSNLEEGEKITEDAIKKRENKEYVILPKRGLPLGPLSKYQEIKFSLSPRDEGKWTIEAIKKDEIGFDNRMYFPKSWGGLTFEELDKVTKIPGGVFCHKLLFITVAKDKNTAIKLVEAAIKEGNVTGAGKSGPY